jgi:hypothetical protein
VKTLEQVHSQQEVPIGLWRQAASREGFWTQMRDGAAEHAATEGKVLTDTPDSRSVLYVRYVSGPGDEARLAECAESEAEFARLRLSCWAVKQ